MDSPAPVEGKSTAPVRTGGDLPAVRVHQDRGDKRPPAVSGEPEDHVADLAREDLSPQDGHQSIVGSDVHPATHAGLGRVELDHVLDRATVPADPRQKRAGLGASLARVDPTEVDLAVRAHRQAVE